LILSKRWVAAHSKAAGDAKKTALPSVDSNRSMISHRYADAHTERRRARSWSDLDIGPNHDNSEPSIMAKLSLLPLIVRPTKTTLQKNL
jgi:hypothetical protein